MLTAGGIFTRLEKRDSLEIDLVLQTCLARREMDIISEQRWLLLCADYAVKGAL
jgi:hypothetical protein